MERLLVTIEETADALAVGRTTVYGLLRSGELTAAKIGRRSLVTVESVLAYAGKISNGGIQ